MKNNKKDFLFAGIAFVLAFAVYMIFGFNQVEGELSFSRAAIVGLTTGGMYSLYRAL